MNNKQKQDEKITMNHGAGGAKMGELVSELRKTLELKGNWNGQLDDGAYLNSGNSFLVI
ncbi:hypothetical protein GQ473_02390, partial [archaeon]|nr:hypothetical protein [archaeon]